MCTVRTIMALWRARALTPEQKVQIVEEESQANGIHTAEEESIAKNLQGAEEEREAKSLDEDSEAKGLHAEESGSFLGVEDVNMSVVYSSILSLPVSILFPFYPNLMTHETKNILYLCCLGHIKLHL